MSFKNILLIDIDSEREESILFSKPDSVTEPTNKEEGIKTVIDDIKTLSHALGLLIDFADANDFAKKEVLIQESFKVIKGENKLPTSVENTNNDTQ